MPIETKAKRAARARVNAARLRLTPLLAAIPALCAVPAWAQQRAQDNAVTVASDAFGTSIGLQNVGLYSQTDARGFDPQQAGNLRIEGLYFDQESFVTNSCMVRETAMRIGIAAQSYSFPSPTGIADFSLRTPGEQASFSGIASRGPFDGTTLQLEQQMPLVPHTLGVDVCAGYDRNFAVDNMRHDGTASFGVTLRWNPTDSIQVVPFWSYMNGGGRQILPLLYTDGTVAPRQFRQRDLAAQTWTTEGWRSATVGALVKAALSAHWQVTAGLFHSRESDPWSFDPYLQLNADHSADSSVDVLPPQRADATSGEMRLTGVSIHGVRRQELQIAVRGRNVARGYGGDEDLDFGNVTLTERTLYAQPPLVLTQHSEDRTQQFDVGATYEERWQDVGSIAFGVLKDHYRRSAQVPSFAAETFRTAPWLLDARLALEGGPHVIYYASYIQGLEDSAQAPVTAVNRGEPPAAARTWQVDGGIRYAWEQLRVIFGVFDIHKPYLNLDDQNIYRPLGRLHNEGVESSLSYNRDGLTLLAGGVWLRPQLNLNFAPGGLASEPVGPVPLTLTANLDLAPSQWGPWAASLQWNRLSSRYVTSDDRQRLPPLATVGAGLRYQWTRGEKSWTLRFDGFNLANAEGLHVSSLYLVLPEQGRRFTLTLATDL